MPLMASITAALISDAARLLIALVLVGGTVVLLLARVDVPAGLWTLDGAAVGFYFGGLALRS